MEGAERKSSKELGREAGGAGSYSYFSRKGYGGGGWAETFSKIGSSGGLGEEDRSTSYSPGRKNAAPGRHNLFPL